MSSQVFVDAPEVEVSLEVPSSVELSNVDPPLFEIIVDQEATTELVMNDTDLLGLAGPAAQSIIEVVTEGAEPVLDITQEAQPVIEITGIGMQGARGAGLPTGGLTGRVLTKKTSDDYDYEWKPFPYVLLEPGQTAADVPADAPHGALIVEKLA